MKYAGPVRAQLWVRSVFNILGPLANPAMTNYIVLGVYEKELVRPMADVMKNLGVKRALIENGDDGLDEISISSTTSVCEIDGDEIKEYTIDPEELGLTLAKKEDIVGGTADENAIITKDILTGKEQGAKRDIVLLNAGAALYTIGKAETIKDGVKLAAEMIDSGKSNEKKKQFIEKTNVKKMKKNMILDDFVEKRKEQLQREKDNIVPQDMKEMALNSKNKNHGFKEALKKSG